MEKIPIPSFYTKDDSDGRVVPIPIPSFYSEKGESIVSPAASCTGYCEHFYQACGECQACLGSCQECQTVSEKPCDYSCQYACENYCQTDCESCETACLGTCLVACQVCENQCQSNCQVYCEETCLASCQSCQTTCEVLAQGCQTTCEVSVQDTTRPLVYGVTATPVYKSENSYSVRLNWSASDVGSGLSHFWAYHSPPNQNDLSSTGLTLSSGTRTLLVGNDSWGNTFKEGNTYYFQIRAVDNAENESLNTSGRVSITIAVTPVAKPTIKVGTKTISSVNLTISATGTITSYALEQRSSKNSTWISVAGTTGARNVTGLENGVTYDFRARAVRDGVYSPYSDLVTVNIGSPRPDNWYWNVSIASGADFSGYSADGKTAYLMSASHWNTFTDRIRLFRQYKTPTNLPSFTQVGSGTTVTATIINQAIDAINVMGFSMPRVVSGVTDVSASVFTTMSTNLNSIT